MPEERHFYTAKEFADMIRKHYDTVIKLLNARCIPGKKVGGSWLIPAWYVKGLLNQDKNRQG